MRKPHTNFFADDALHRVIKWYIMGSLVLEFSSEDGNWHGNHYNFDLITITL